MKKPSLLLIAFIMFVLMHDASAQNVGQSPMWGSKAECQTANPGKVCQSGYLDCGMGHDKFCEGKPRKEVEIWTPNLFWLSKETCEKELGGTQCFSINCATSQNEHCAGAPKSLIWEPTPPCC